MTTSIDPTDYVEVENGNLSFPIEAQQAKFELGVCMAVYKWEELATAVENSWGGPKSAEKRDWISGIVIDLFKESSVVDIQLIEETLLYAMVDEFDVQVDNDSALEIAALVMKFYKQVQEHKYDQVDALYAKWQEKRSTHGENRHVHIDEDPNNPDVSDDDDDEEEDEDDDMEIDGNNDGKQEHKEEPIVDDDGFQLVQKKGRRR
ncbi:TSR2 [Candida margitis]|uniref:TSR2 n=1 Tax=Candida margitis TaxID=1775924 RepID=UPI0022266959|nr:TSR2 [Candida margitis]KAI5956648.1 TSR2 [Candida margitis]